MDSKKRVEAANEEIRAYREWLEEQVAPAESFLLEKSAERKNESFSTRGYPLNELETRRTILAVFMDRFNDRLAALALDRPHVHYLDLRGTLPEEGLWANELHPTNVGFKLIARKFNRLIEDLVADDEQ